MARRRRHYIASPAFNEFLQHIFLSATQEDKKFLTGPELKKIAPGKLLQAFAADGHLEEKLLLAAKVGYRSFLIISPAKWNVNKLRKLYMQYHKKGNRDEIIQMMIDDKIFCFGSDQMLLSASYMNKNCITDYWVLNRNYQKIYKLWEMLGPKLGIKRVDEEAKEISKGASFLLEVSYKQNKFAGRFADYGLQSPMDMAILMCLMRKTKTRDYRSVFTSDTELFNEMNDGDLKKNGFSVRLNWLNNNGYIEKGLGKDFAISDRGLMIVMDHLNRLAEEVSYTM